MSENMIELKDVTTKFGPQVVHQDLNLTVKRGEIVGLVGGSGSGKTVLLNTIIGLNKAASGQISVFGQRQADLYLDEKPQTRWGVLYQNGALFSSLSVAENIKLPMKEVAHIPDPLINELTLLKLQMVGLDPSVASKLPSELSGGMIKRVALARALATDAELIFLDEPTAGLDPISAAAFDQLIRTLQKSLNLTVVMITHDLDSLFAICDRVAVLVDKKIIIDTPDQIVKTPHPWIQSYFRGIRGRAITEKKNGH